MGNHLFVIFAVLDVSCAVNSCINHSFFYIYIYIIVNFQLRSCINVGLTEHYFYNRFCIERSAKIGFLGDFGGGAKIFGGNPLRMQ